MYGLLLENMAEYIRQTYGEERWEDIRRQAGVEQPSFSVHQVYPENLITRLAKKAQEVSKIIFLWIFTKLAIPYDLAYVCQTVIILALLFYFCINYMICKTWYGIKHTSSRYITFHWHRLRIKKYYWISLL